MTTTQITNQDLQTLINVNAYDNNGDRAAANVWENINDYCEGEGGFFQVKTYLATLLTALDRRLTDEQMDQVFPVGHEIITAFGWTTAELFEHDIHKAIFEGDEETTSVVYDRTAELAGATEADLAEAENKVAYEFALALQNVLAQWEDQLPQLTDCAAYFVEVARQVFA